MISIWFSGSMQEYREERTTSLFKTIRNQVRVTCLIEMLLIFSLSPTLMFHVCVWCFNVILKCTCISDSPIQPNLWLMVNPNLACPIKYPKKVTKILSPKVPLKHLAPVPKSTVPHVKPKSIPNVLPVSPTEDICLADSLHDASSSECMVGKL